MADRKMHEYIDRLKAGDVAALSRAITLVESKRVDHQQAAAGLIDEILPLTGRSFRVGVTGVPGVGKSTFIEALGLALIQQGHKVAVLAVDPSSGLSRGSILGDKTRMEQLSVHPSAFIRPSASGGSLGGIAYKTREAMLLCEAAGFDFILVETVGVGQSETAVKEITDFFLLLMLAGAGDELQGIKRGIMELADSLVIHKADGDNLKKAKAARTEYARALHFLSAHESGWRPEVLLASSYDQTGIEEVLQLLDKYERHQKANGYFDENRRRQNKMAFHRLLEQGVLTSFLTAPAIKRRIELAEDQVRSHQVSPYTAARGIVEAALQST